MIDFYANTDPRYRPYIRKAQIGRSAAFTAAFHALWTGPWRALQRAANHLRRARARRNARAELSGLSDGALKDIGVARCEIGSIVHTIL